MRSQDGDLCAQALEVSSAAPPLVSRRTLPRALHVHLAPPGSFLSGRPLGTTRAWETRGVFSSMAPGLLRFLEMMEGVGSAAFSWDCAQEETSAESGWPPRCV